MGCHKRRLGSFEGLAVAKREISKPEPIVNSGSGGLLLCYLHGKQLWQCGRGLIVPIHLEYLRHSEHLPKKGKPATTCAAAARNGFERIAGQQLLSFGTYVGFAVASLRLVLYRAMLPSCKIRELHISSRLVRMDCFDRAM